jgi:hypothetical protein
MPEDLKQGLACKQSAGEKAPGRLFALFVEYSSEASGYKYMVREGQRVMKNYASCCLLNIR